MGIGFGRTDKAAKLAVLAPLNMNQLEIMKLEQQNWQIAPGAPPKSSRGLYFYLKAPQLAPLLGQWRSDRLQIKHAEPTV